MATRTKIPSDELERLRTARTESHAALLQIKRQRNEWDDQTQILRSEYSALARERSEDWIDSASQRPRPGTELAKFETRVKARLAEANPHDGPFVAARAKYHKADEAFFDFLRSRFLDLVDEGLADFELVEAKYRQAFELMIEASDDYNQLVEHVRSLVNAMPGLDGQSLTHDLRPHQWKGQAQDALDGSLVRPGLTQAAEHKLAAQR
jgi:hypothetical protein